MFRRIAAGICLFGALAISASIPSSAPLPVEGALRSVNLFNLPESVTEAEFVDALRELNEVVHSTGHMDAGYLLLKIKQAQIGDTPSIGRDYVMIGHWASQSAYDEIHENAAYIAAGETLGPIFDALDESRIYSRYEQLSVGGPGER